MRRDETSGFLEFAKGTANNAGKILMAHFAKGIRFKKKSDGSLVTPADMASDSYIRAALSKKYPGHAVLAEESGLSGGGSEYMWLVDPLDGTHDYVFGIPLFGVSIALYRNEKPLVGVIYLPFYKRMYYAARGGGAFMNGNKIRVSKEREEQLLLYDSYFKGKKATQLSSIGKLADATSHIRIIGSSVVNFAWVASGVADAYVERTIYPYDIAAGCLIVEEAGGKVTEISGAPWHLRSDNLIASNGRVHGRLVELLR